MNSWQMERLAATHRRELEEAAAARAERAPRRRHPLRNRTGSLLVAMGVHLLDLDGQLFELGASRPA